MLKQQQFTKVGSSAKLPGEEVKDHSPCTPLELQKCIQAYGEIVERGIDSKEADEKLLADDGIKARVEEFSHFYMKRKLGEFRNGIARGTIQLDPDLPNPAEVA